MCLGHADHLLLAANPPACHHPRTARARSRGPAEIALAFVTIAAIAAMVAVRTSRWYIAPAGSGIIVILVSGAAGTHVLDVTFTERIAETALGAGLALTFGVAIPPGMRWLTRQRGTGQSQHAVNSRY